MAMPNFNDVEPLALDDPHWDGDEIYAAMSLHEKQGLCRMVAWRRQMEAWMAAHPPQPSIPQRTLAVLEKIEGHLAVLVAAAREVTAVTDSGRAAEGGKSP